MKGFGIFSLVLAGLNIIIAFIAIACGAAEAAGSKFAAGLMLGALGAFLVHRAKQKQEEAEKKQQWENENK